MKPTEEIWKPVPYETFSKYYEVSNIGRVRVVPHYIECYNRWSIQKRWVPGGLIKIRTNGIEKHLFADLRKTFDGVQKSKSAYVHKMVGLVFKTPSKDPQATKVIFIDGDYTHIWPSNLKWVSQSYLSKKSMVEATPERRNWIGNYQSKTAGSSPENIEYAKDLFKQGVKISEIGPRLGLSKTWAYYHLDKFNKDIQFEKSN